MINTPEALDPDSTPDSMGKNVLGNPLAFFVEGAGFYRDGYCRTGPDDAGRHVIAAIVTQEFLDYTRAQGNDLETPRPESLFPGLKSGDCWCLCATRWSEAESAGVAPPVLLEATHEKALQYLSQEVLTRHGQSSWIR